jgi:hypothetical protein
MSGELTTEHPETTIRKVQTNMIFIFITVPLFILV